MSTEPIVWFYQQVEFIQKVWSTPIISFISDFNTSPLSVAPFLLSTARLQASIVSLYVVPSGRPAKWYGRLPPVRACVSGWLDCTTFPSLPLQWCLPHTHSIQLRALLSPSSHNFPPSRDRNVRAMRTRRLKTTGFDLLLQRSLGLRWGLRLSDRCLFCAFFIIV